MTINILFCCHNTRTLWSTSRLGSVQIQASATSDKDRKSMCKSSSDRIPIDWSTSTNWFV